MAPVIVDKKKVRSFSTESEFGEWLANNHASETEVWLRIYKKGSGVQTVTVVQALDVVLCWGWIDGIRKGLDDVSFLQRYTPRKNKSIWSQINRDHVARLVAAGRMTTHGQHQVDRAKADGRWDAAYAPMRSATEATLPADLRAAIAANPRASAAVQKLGRANLFSLGFRTNQMKTPAGRARKVTELVAMLARGETILPEARVAEARLTKTRVAKARVTKTSATKTRVAKARVTKTSATKARVTKARVTKAPRPRTR